VIASAETGSFDDAFVEMRDAARGEADRRSATVRELMTGSLQDLIEDLEQLRPCVAVAFDESTWKATRKQLEDLGRRRDSEIFGRPAPPNH
jgi:hypothetical protein